MGGVHHLVELAPLGRSGMSALIERARAWRSASPPGPSGPLAGREVVLLFLEPSTRTKLSFEIAASRLGATVLDFAADASSLRKGETLADTVHTIEAMGTDAWVVRHSVEGTAAELARIARGAVINAGDGTAAHPTQGLLDLLTLLEEFDDLDGRRIAIVGDVRHSRVARSDVEAFSAFGAEVILVGPPELRPAELPPGATAADDLDTLLPELDAVVLLRIQRERLAADLDLDVDDYIRRYQLTEERLARVPAHGIVLHPGPMNRGVEVTDAVADGPRSRILAQVGHGVAVRMAVLEWCLTGDR